ncbi:MAG TPA: hypothetical protein VGF19_14940, partial [Candidatus Acidoferrum sp.]
FQAGYNRLLTPQTQIALVYGYQGFDFSVQGTAFHTHVIQGLYGHRITGRLDFLVGAGPQMTFVNTQTAACSLSIVAPYYCQSFGGTLIPTTEKNTNIGVSAQARVRYKFQKASVYLDFKRYDTNGSGFFAGAQSDIVSLGGDRPLSRVWDSFINVGYSHSTRLQPLSTVQLIQCGNPLTQAACPANNADSYNYGFAGAGVHRSFGRELHAYFSYQFNRISFASSFCATAPCNRISNQSTATLGLDWTPRPIRID